MSATGLPIIRPGDRIDLSPEGAAYELPSGDVFLIALYFQGDADEASVAVARDAAVASMRTKLPTGFSEPEPCGDWMDLVSSGYFGYARKFIAKRTA